MMGVCENSSSSDTGIIAVLATLVLTLLLLDVFGSGTDSELPHWSDQLPTTDIMTDSAYPVVGLPDVEQSSAVSDIAPDEHFENARIFQDAMARLASEQDEPPVIQGIYTTYFPMLICFFL